MDKTTKYYEAFSDNLVSGYPLTDGELSVLAAQWWDVVIDLGIFLTLSGCYGGAESRCCRYANDRLDHLEQLLRPEEFERICGEVEARWKGVFSEEEWTAFKEGRALWQEEAHTAVPEKKLRK